MMIMENDPIVIIRLTMDEGMPQRPVSLVFAVVVVLVVIVDVVMVVVSEVVVVVDIVLLVVVVLEDELVSVLPQAS